MKNELPTTPTPVGLDVESGPFVPLKGCDEGIVMVPFQVIAGGVYVEREFIPYGHASTYIHSLSSDFDCQFNLNEDHIEIGKADKRTLEKIVEWCKFHATTPMKKLEFPLEMLGESLADYLLPFDRDWLPGLLGQQDPKTGKWVDAKRDLKEREDCIITLMHILYVASFLDIRHLLQLCEALMIRVMLSMSTDDQDKFALLYEDIPSFDEDHVRALEASFDQEQTSA